MVALVGGVSVAITALEGFLLAPTMLGQAARVNSVAVFVCIMFWGWLWGGVGLIIAVPVLMIVKTIADHVDSLQGLRELLSD
jgi:predicted PurR-regulated permease PerM